jgi:hypothetical protein
MKHCIAILLALAGTGAVAAGVDEKTSWEHAPTDYKVPAGMVPGGAFIDRILPMPVPDGLKKGAWGGDNVQPRNVENGLEDPQWSYWCMNVHRDAKDGKEHMFAVRWPENSPKGHMTWPNSRVVHAVADSPFGPFKVTQEIGPGHNVQWYQAKDGTNVLYAIGRAYTSKSLEGPWEKYDLQYDLRGGKPVAMSNHTFTRREDGSYLMVSRGGHMWISEDGLKPFKKITDKSAYPPIKGEFEDPCVWRDEVQYNLIVNDWFGRTAYYLRSKDGVEWTWDQGKAYDVNVARHEDGTQEKWYKFERPNVRQDEFGRATHIYFAVIDSRKDLDKGNDGHGSKIIALPLVVQKRLQILNDQPVTAETKEIRVLIKAETGFDPAADIDLQSLSFGAPASIDFGKGGKMLKSEPSGKDLVVTFAGDAGFIPADYAGKLLGKDKKGGLLFGYARLPGKNDLKPILALRNPQLAGTAASLTVENFGQVASAALPMQVLFKTGAGEPTPATVDIPAIPPCGNFTVEVQVPEAIQKSGQVCTVEMTLNPGNGKPLVAASRMVSALSPGQDGLATLSLANAVVDKSGWNQSQTDRSIEGKPLRIGSAAFPHGIGTHAPSEQAWRLAGKFQTLSFVTGIDRDHAAGTAIVQVWGDGKKLFETPLLKAGAEPFQVKVSVKGVKELKIVSTDGGDGLGGDHVDLCDLTLAESKK